jgi:hypothetical protein
MMKKTREEKLANGGSCSGGCVNHALRSGTESWQGGQLCSTAKLFGVSTRCLGTAA